MALAHPKNELVEAIRQYIALPNRENWLVLRKHSRARVRAWLKGLPQISDQVISAEFWDTAIGRFQIYIPGREDIGRALKHLTPQSPIGPQALDAYLNAHPEALTGNAEAELCPKHSAWTQDVPRLRETLRMLMDPSIEVTRRVDEVLGETYRLPGLGPATATTILECWNDGKDEIGGPIYSKWTGHTERALRMLGIQFRETTEGETYASIWRQQKRMLCSFREFKDLSDIDLFMFFADPRGLDMGKR